MNDMYSSGLPYSDELYHHGIPGQKWGVRRFQNPDGSLTSEGRKRYSKGGGESKTIKSGSHKTGKDFVKGAAAVGMKAASRLGEGVARGVKTKLAEKMPFMLNDEELEKYRDRLRRENTFRNEMATRRELKRRSQGDQFAKKLVQDVAGNAVKTVANKAVNKLADEAFKSSSDRLKEQLDLEAKELAIERSRKEASENKARGRLYDDVNEMNDMKEEEADNNRKIDSIKRQGEIKVREHAMRFSEYVSARDSGKTKEANKIMKQLRKLENEIDDLNADYTVHTVKSVRLSRKIAAKQESIDRQRKNLDAYVRDSNKNDSNSNDNR